jgi:hypothetical protein
MSESSEATKMGPGVKFFGKGLSELKTKRDDLKRDLDGIPNALSASWGDGVLPPDLPEVPFIERNPPGVVATGLYLIEILNEDGSHAGWGALEYEELIRDDLQAIGQIFILNSIEGGYVMTGGLFDSYLSKRWTEIREGIGAVDNALQDLSAWLASHADISGSIDNSAVNSAVIKARESFEALRLRLEELKAWGYSAGRHE